MNSIFTCRKISLDCFANKSGGVIFISPSVEQNIKKSIMTRVENGFRSSGFSTYVQVYRDGEPCEQEVLYVTVYCDVIEYSIDNPNYPDTWSEPITNVKLL